MADGIIRDRRQNRPAREQALVLAASRLFASSGFEATTTREIALEAGCAEGLIHRYFGGKYGLLLAIIDRRTAEEFHDLDRRLPPADTLEDDILQMIEFDIDRMWNDREFLRVVIPRAFFDRHLALLLSSVPSHRTAAIRQRLRKFEAGRGLPEPELESVATFIAVVGFMFGFMRPVSLGHDLQDSRQMAKNIATILVRGLSDNPPSAATERSPAQPGRLPAALFS